MKNSQLKRHDGLRNVKALVALAVAVSVGFPASGYVQEPVFIGDAHMQEDGTIIVNLRRTTDGVHVSGIVRYRVDNPHYKEVLDHIGGLKPGEVKLVPAWDDAKSKKEEPSR